MKKKNTSPESGCFILAFGAHPDDIELSVGGTLAKAARAGRKCAAVDLTAGEAGTRGTPAERLKESKRAANLLRLAGRENLGLPDAALEFSVASRRIVADVIRRHRPEIILAPWIEDLHPDHAVAGRIVQAAMFDARLAKLAADGTSWFTRLILFYPCRHYVQPTTVVDISGEHKVKKRAWEAHRSQRGGSGKKEFRPRGVVDPFVLVEVRDRHYGTLIGAEYGEGLISPTPLHLECLSRLGVDLEV
jgi:bacillithiol biosynthesis deacetylase BshB1